MPQEQEFDIAHWISQIRSAVYGRDVRTAIAEGISMCYTDVSDGVTILNTALGTLQQAVHDANEAEGSATLAAGRANDAADSVNNSFAGALSAMVAEGEETREYLHVEGGGTVWPSSSQA